MEILNPSVVSGTKEYHLSFLSARPFKHVVIDDFFNPAIVEGLVREFPTKASAQGLKTEYGGAAIKGARSDVRNFGLTFRMVDDYVASAHFKMFMEEITGFGGLVYDPNYEGAGIHENFPGRRGNIHVDFNYHRASGLHRRINAIIYISPDWREEWGGAIKLYEDGWKPDTSYSLKIPCLFNRCVLFETNEVSWHGVETIAFNNQPPPWPTRKSFTIYMYSATRPQQEVTERHETVYVPGERPRFLIENRLRLEQSDVSELTAYLDDTSRLIRNLYDREKKFSSRISNLRKSLEQAGHSAGKRLPDGLEYGRKKTGPHLHPSWPEPRDTTRSCPVCGGKSGLTVRGSLPITTAPRYSRNSFDYIECPKCDVIYISPLPTAEDFQALYSKTDHLFRTPTYTDSARIGKIESYFDNRLANILLRMKREPSATLDLLEVGAGLAWMCRAAKRLNSGSQTTAQDVGDREPEDCRGVDYYHLGNMDDRIVEQRGPYDIISMTHVIEHLPDPLHSLGELAKMLRSGGLLFITAPFRPNGWMQTDDFSSAWNRYHLNHVPAHITYFSERGLKDAAMRSGLELCLWHAGKNSGAFEAWLSPVITRNETDIASDARSLAGMAQSRIW